MYYCVFVCVCVCVPVCVCVSVCVCVCLYRQAQHNTILLDNVSKFRAAKKSPVFLSRSPIRAMVEFFLIKLLCCRPDSLVKLAGARLKVRVTTHACVCVCALWPPPPLSSRLYYSPQVGQRLNTAMYSADQTSKAVSFIYIYI